MSDTLVRPLGAGDLTALGLGAWAAHLLASDPGGCWVAEERGRPVGHVLSARRDLTWVLAAYDVPAGEDELAAQLLDAARTHGRLCLRALAWSSSDPAAARRLRLAGFSLHPTMRATGRVARALLPVVEHVRPGEAGDLDLCNSVDRRVRDAAHGVDHPHLLGSLRLLVTDRPGASGYAYVDGDGSPVLLAATSRRTAAALLWECLAASDPTTAVEVGRLTPANEWAVDVCLAAGLAVGTCGYLGVHGVKPPSPYLPAPHFL